MTVIYRAKQNAFFYVLVLDGSFLNCIETVVVLQGLCQVQSHFQFCVPKIPTAML